MEERQDYVPLLYNLQDKTEQQLNKGLWNCGPSFLQPHHPKTSFWALLCVKYLDKKKYKQPPALQTSHLSRETRVKLRCVSDLLRTSLILFSAQQEIRRNIHLVWSNVLKYHTMSQTVCSTFSRGSRKMEPLMDYMASFPKGNNCLLK